MKTRKNILRAAALAALAALLLSLTACGAPEDSGASGQTVPLAASGAGDNAPAAAGSDTQSGTGADSGTQPETDADAADDEDQPVEDISEFFTNGILMLPCAPNAFLPLSDGAALFTDTQNRVVWRLVPEGMELYAGIITEAVDVNDRPLGGYADGEDIKSLFALPWGLAPFLDGCAVSDAENNVVRLIKDGKVGTLNATGSNAKFDYPTGLAAGEDGCLYVSDTNNGRVCRITTEGRITTVAKGLKEPMGLSFRDGVLYIAEAGANRVLQLTDGKLTVLAGQGADGYEDGKAADALFCAPRAVLAAEDCVYVSDTANSAVRRIKDGTVETLFARDFSDQTQLVPASPAGLALRDGELYVCDSFANAILKLSPEE